jgi:hypothetical protein
MFLQLNLSDGIINNDSVLGVYKIVARSVPAELRNELNYIFVDTAAEVLEHALDVG